MGLFLENSISAGSLLPLPGRDRARKRMRIGPTNEGLIFVVLGALLIFAAFNSGTNLVYLVASVLGGFYFTSLLYGLFTLPGLSVETHLDREATEGAEFTWAVTVRNESRFARHFLEIRPRFRPRRQTGISISPWSELHWSGGDRKAMRMLRQLRRRSSPGEPGRLRRALAELSRQGIREGRPGKLLHVAPGEEVRLTLRTTLNGRGEYRLGCIDIHTVYPLNLFRVFWSCSSSGRVVVVPTPLRPFYTASTAAEVEVASESMLDSHRGEGLDYHGLREYIPGDPPRRIHWKISARTGRLMVREHQQNRSARYYLFLDLDERKQQGEGPSSRLEWCVKLAATVCRELVQANCHSQIILLADEYAPSPSIFTASDLAILLRYLGTVPYTHRGTLQGMLSRSAGHLEPDSQLIFILPEAGPDECAAIGGLSGTGYGLNVLLNVADRAEATRVRRSPGVDRLSRLYCRILLHSRATDSLC